jgi:DNA-binding ferritin-like protein
MQKALYVLADCFNCVSGNIHTLHLNVRGTQFDTVHKQWTQEYYEALDEDYDSAAEWGRCYGEPAPNKNESAARINFQSLEAKPYTCLEATIAAFKSLQQLVNQMQLTLKLANQEAENDPIATGVANWLQTRIEYWVKEIMFFLKNRLEAVE